MNSPIDAVAHAFSTLHQYVQALFALDQLPLGDLFLRIAFFVGVGGLIYFIWRLREATRQNDAKFLSYLFPASIYSHQSSKIDYASVPLRIALDSSLQLVLPPVTLLSVYAWLRRELGQPVLSVPDVWPIEAVKFFIYFMISDFFAYIHHYLFHKIPSLWRLHRAHHSAEVLSPLTFYRFSPVEVLVSNLIVGLGTGSLSGCVFYFAGMRVSTLEVAAFQGVIFLIYVILEPFYHSHIWISFGRLNRFLLSPCMHQIHHSALLEHRDKNLGGRLTLWDYVFGTLYVPKTKEQFPFGISTEESGEFNPHTTLGEWLLEPLRGFVQAVRGTQSEKASSQNSPSSTAPPNEHSPRRS